MTRDVRLCIIALCFSVAATISIATVSCEMKQIAMAKAGFSYNNAEHLVLNQGSWAKIH